MKKTALMLLFVLFVLVSTHAKQRGYATYYGSKMNNRRTASGIIYKRNEMVCAHLKYPFGTKLLVKNINNNKTVVVEVIDRGPFFQKKELLISLTQPQSR